MGMLSPKAYFTTHRLGESPLSNADRVYVRIGGPAVVVDGASVSYDPQSWAELVAENLDVGEPLSQLRPLAEQFTANIPENLPWNLEVLAERGAHATYLAMRPRRFMGVNFVEADAVGDCLLLVHRPGNSVETLTWPYSHSGQFPTAPSTVASVAPLIRGTTHPTLRCSIPKGTRLFLMTDALGRFTCRHFEQGGFFHELAFTRPGIHTDEFVRWTIDQRVSGLLEDDDLTVVEVEVA